MPSSKKLGTVGDHPVTGVTCHYYLMIPVSAQEPQNLDPQENAEVRFVPISDLETYIHGFILPAIMEMLTSPDIGRALPDDA